MTLTTIASSGELEKLSAPELVKLFNSLNPPSPVKRFSDKETAVRRCLALLGAAQGSPKAPPPSSMPKGKPDLDAKPAAPELAKMLQFPAKSKTKATRTQPEGPRPIQFDLKARPNIKPHRLATKRAKVIEMLSAPGGATFEEVMEAIGWDRRTTFEGIKLLHIHLGYGIKEDPSTHKIRLVKGGA